MSNTLDTRLVSLREKGWQVAYRPDGVLVFPEPFITRYQAIPQEYEEFLHKVSLCSSPSDTAWFLCGDDFLGQSTSAFLWNEFEQESLKSAAGDKELTAAITDFWNKHCPIALSVKGGYAHLSISLSEYDFGFIVGGCEPEYEDVTVIASSFRECLSQLNKADNSKASLFLQKFR